MSKFAMLFSGQGSQYVGMGKDLYDTHPVAKQVFEEANDKLSFDLAELIFNGTKEELTQTENTQPAILAMSVAAYRVYMEEIGIKPDYMAGHSLGEISALTCAGALEFGDAIVLARSRGLYMADTTKNAEAAMAAVVGVDIAVIEEECVRASSENNVAVLSNINSPSQIVISGHKPAVLAASQALKDRGAQVTPLNVSAAFHSPLMQPAADRFQADIERLALGQGKLQTSVLSNVTGLPYAGRQDIASLLTTQIVAPVRWMACMEYLQQAGVTYALEIGPGKTLRNLVAKNVTGIAAHSFDQDEKEEVRTAVSAYRKKVKSFLSRCLGIAVTAQNRNFNNDDYQRSVVEPYRAIQQLKDQLEAAGQEPTGEQVREAFELLRQVLEGKQVPMSEQVNRFNQLIAETATEDCLEDVIQALEERAVLQ